MPKITKIYTRTGDDGTTSLGGNVRISKSALRINVIGEVDELNALIGLALSHDLAPDLSHSLSKIQNELFHLGADLAFPDSKSEGIKVPKIEQLHIDQLEELIDRLNEKVGPLENFILPGGASGAAALQVARAVCRRAERLAVALNTKENLNPVNLIYLNRLSDALFVMGRYENFQKGIPEPLWDSRA